MNTGDTEGIATKNHCTPKKRNWTRRERDFIIWLQTHWPWDVELIIEEPETFQLGPHCKYTPDFKVNGTYIELVGSKQALHFNWYKVQTFKALYPDKTLLVLRPDGTVYPGKRKVEDYRAWFVAQMIRGFLFSKGIVERQEIKGAAEIIVAGMKNGKRTIDN